jgi:hypothetical protein
MTQGLQSGPRAMIGGRSSTYASGADLGATDVLRSRHPDLGGRSLRGLRRAPLQRRHDL